MKGILFKPWKIKAIAESSPDMEWQTRRLIKPQPTHFHYNSDGQYPCTKEGEQFKPRYQVGEVCYIKEAWWTSDPTDGDIYYKVAWPEGLPVNMIAENGEWRSPLFMPAWAARYFIQITAVRAERLQEITGEDCVSEGVVLPYRVFGDGDSDYYDGIGESYVHHFSALWDSINPKNLWVNNDWVWVYTFKRVRLSDDH